MKGTTRRQVHLMLGAFLLCLTVGSGQADVLFVNDFGTVNQSTAGGSGQWTEQNLWGDASSAVQYASSEPFTLISVDLDGDGLHGTLYLNNTGETIKRWSQKIDAPDGFSFSDLSITAHGWGNGPDWAANFSVALSNDGVHWDYEVGSSGFLKYYERNPITASSGADAAYTKLHSVWISFILSNPNNALQVSAPAITDVTLNGTLVSPSGTLVLLQ